MVRNKWYDVIMTEYNGRVPDVNTIEDTLLRIQDDQTRIFCILGYLTGGRISEIVNYEQAQWIKKAKRDKNRNTIKDESGKTIYEWIKRPKETLIRHQGLIKSNILKEKIRIKNTGKEIEVLRITMRNEKNRTQHFKTIYAPYFFEKRLIENLFDHLRKLNDKDVIIDQNRIKTYKEFRKYAENLYYPHFIRALRVGVLIEVYGLESQQIKEFMGWTSTKPLDAYYIFKKDYTILLKYSEKQNLNMP